MVKIKTLLAIILIAGMSVLGMTAVAYAAPAHHAPKVYGPHGNQCFKTTAALPTQWDHWNVSILAMDTISHLRHCTTFSYVSKSEHLVQGGSKGKLCFTQYSDSFYYIRRCEKHRKSQEVFFSSVDHGKRAEIHTRLDDHCVTLDLNPITQNPPGADLQPQDCAASNQNQYWYWQSPAKKKAPSAGLTAAVRFTGGGKGPGRCKWHANGSKDAGTVRIRLTLDHCRRTQMRLRAAGESALPDTWHTGNWVDKVHQLTSINISPEVYADYGYDLQYCWHGCKHKGRVRYISTDPGAGSPVAQSFWLTAAHIPAVHVTKFFIRNGAGGDMAYLNKARWLTTSGVKRHGLKFEETDVAACTKAQGIRCFELKTVGTDKCVTRAHRRHRTYAGYKILPCKKLKTQLFFYNQIKTPGHTLIDAKYNDCMEGFELEYNLADPKCMPISQGQESWYFRTRF